MEVIDVWMTVSFSVFDFNYLECYMNLAYQLLNRSQDCKDKMGLNFL
jgi:hypothetical protein